MNYFLQLDKKLILITIFLVIFFIILFQFFLSKENILIDNKLELSNVDISKPRFSINNNSKKIFITAEEGNFISSDEIMLKKNVTFKSNDFSIEAENVIFNRSMKTAYSNNKSYFKTNNAIIKSDGFDISDQGNKIIFHGKSTVLLK